MDQGNPEQVWGLDSEISLTGLTIAMKTSQLLAQLPIDLNINKLKLKLHN